MMRLRVLTLMICAKIIMPHDIFAARLHIFAAYCHYADAADMLTLLLSHADGCFRAMLLITLLMICCCR